MCYHQKCPYYFIHIHGTLGQCLVTYVLLEQCVSVWDYFLWIIIHVLSCLWCLQIMLCTKLGISILIPSHFPSPHSFLKLVSEQSLYEYCFVEMSYWLEWVYWFGQIWLCYMVVSTYCKFSWAYYIYYSVRE